MTIVTRAELLRTGIGRGALDYRVRAGTLHRVLPGVYSTEAPTYSALCRAVQVWRGDAVLSHDTAAWMWGLLEHEPSIVHATIPVDSAHRSPEWLVLHRRTIGSVAYKDLLPLVTMEQCFIDVATTLDTARLERFVDHALTRKVRWRAVAQACDAARGMAGVAAVREQLRRCCPRTLSEPERVVARALTARNWHLEINAEVGIYFGDLVDRRARVIVEIDGRAFHTDSYVFTQDRVRQNALVLDGWLMLRYSAVTAMARTDEVVNEIIAVVRRRRRSHA